MRVTLPALDLILTSSSGDTQGQASWLALRGRRSFGWLWDQGHVNSENQRQKGRLRCGGESESGWHQVLGQEPPLCLMLSHAVYLLLGHGQLWGLGEEAVICRDPRQ